MEKKNFAVYVNGETIRESMFSDLVTGVMIAFCVYISQGSTWWTLVTGLMFLLFLFAKVGPIIRQQSSFRTKAELQAWVDGLPDK